MNKKVIGCLPMYFPDEIVHAAGLLPITLFGTNEMITMADRHLMTNACDQVRSTYDGLLKGKYDFVDGIAALHVCDQVRFFLEVWQLDHPFPYFHQMWRPYKMDGSTRPFLVSELRRLKSSFESFTGKEIKDDAIRESIKLYNASRAMMRRLSRFRGKRTGMISESDMLHVVTSSMVMPREVHTKLMEELLSKIENEKKQDEQKIKIVIAGHPCGVPDDGLLNMIEDLGMAIMEDDFFGSGRSIHSDVSLEGDPIESFADFYINAIPCTTYHFPANWGGNAKTYSSYADHVIEMMKRSEAKGIIIIKVMYCDPFDMEFVLLKERLDEEKIPYLALLTEHGHYNLEPMRTRIQAFKETLESH